jgi:phage terminase small subunit
VKKKNRLTAKQEAFVNYYIECGNATEAYKRAGYKSKNDSSAAAAAARLLRNVKIKAAIDAKMKEREKPSIAKADEVLAYLTSVLRGEAKDEQIVVLGTGEGKSKAVRMEVRAPTKDRLKAGEQLLKRYPAELDKAEQKARIKKLEADLKAMEDEQAAANDDVVIIDDWMCENDNENTSS